jgi:formate hydrogenlyase subunit 3/multisubunit Na+/H+ antiporter MnhD subunit
MSLVIFVVVAMSGSVLSLAVRHAARPAAVVGLAGLVATMSAAAAVQPGEVLDLAGTTIVTTAYLRDFLILASIAGLGLGLSGVIAGTRRDAPATTMAILAMGGLTLAFRDPEAAVIVATAAGLFGILVTIGPGSGPNSATVGIREARVVIVAGVLGWAATTLVGGDLDTIGDGSAVISAAYLAFVVAVAMRFGAIPFHLWAARLADTVPEAALPMLTAIAPASLAVVGLTWIDANPMLSSTDLGVARPIVVAIAAASIVLGALAAFVQDDIEHVLGYSIVGDAGVILLAFAVLDPAAWEPARTLILVFVTARSAFAAWAAGIRATFWTGSLDDLRGWARRSPILGGVLIAIIVVSVGIPGMVAFDARVTIVDLALSGPLAGVILLGTLAPIAYYGRLLMVGSRVADQTVRSADDYMPRIPMFDRGDIVGWVRTTATINRTFAAAMVAVALTAVALATSIGVFGSAAAGT